LEFPAGAEAWQLTLFRRIGRHPAGGLELELERPEPQDWIDETKRKQGLRLKRQRVNKNWTENLEKNSGFSRGNVGSMKRTLGGDGWMKIDKELAPGDDFYRG